MTRPILLFALVACVSGCAAFLPRAIGPSAPPPENTSDLRFGSGYRSANDACRRVGQTEFTAQFIRPDADLVACPVDFAGRDDFIKATDPREVARRGGWVLYNVPLVGIAPVTTFQAPPPVIGGG